MERNRRQTAGGWAVEAIFRTYFGSGVNEGLRLPPVVELARRYRTSPSAIREALGVLCALGLVEPGPGGYRVRAAGEDAGLELLRLRLRAAVDRQARKEALLDWLAVLFDTARRSLLALPGTWKGLARSLTLGCGPLVGPAERAELLVGLVAASAEQSGCRGLALTARTLLRSLDEVLPWLGEAVDPEACAALVAALSEGLAHRLRAALFRFEQGVCARVVALTEATDDAPPTRPPDLPLH